MKLIVNGEALEFAATTPAELLAALDHKGDWLATAVNSGLVHKANRVEFRLSEDHEHPCSAEGAPRGYDRQRSS
jgi:sulfur carrier protein